MRTSRKVLDMLIDNLKRNKNVVNDIYDEYIANFDKAKTVEEVMSLKSSMLYALIYNLPMYSSHCYFCLKHNTCDTCEYARHHGVCRSNEETWAELFDRISCQINESNLSDFAKLNLLRQLLLHFVEELYYSGESY